MSDNKDKNDVSKPEKAKRRIIVKEQDKCDACEDDNDSEDVDCDEEEVDVKSDDKEVDEKKEQSKKKRLTQSYREEDQPESVTVKEDVAVLFDGESLSEDFKVKATVIVDGIVKLRVNEEVEKIEKAAQKALEEAVNEIETDLMTKVDDYHDYVASEFIEQNKVAINSGLKMEIYEGFFMGLRKLFVEHNVSIPEEEVNLLEKTNTELEQATKKINSLMESLMLANKTILEHLKKDVVSELSEGLVDTQIEKFKTLTCDIESKDLESFKEKVKIVRENFFKELDDKETPKLEETVPDIDPGVARYLAGAKKYL